MIETSLAAWLSLLCVILLASAAGYLISRQLPWSVSAIKADIPFAAGLALAPFLFGFVSISVLVLFPRAEHVVHLAASLLSLILVAFILAPMSRQKVIAREPSTKTLGLNLLKLCVFVWALLLLVNTIFLPLIANDALEYATVGRELFLNPSLAIYPLLKPQETVSGFFAQWTHPPLYVSMIYLMSVIQGHADAPGLARLIAPWFLLSSTGLMVALGRFCSPAVGWLTGLLYLSTPLLFRGAAEGLIDALPLSAMALMIAAMAGIRQVYPAYLIVVGCVLGIALWTHSQAILFIPMVFAVLLIQQGLQERKRLFRSLCVVFTFAIAVGGCWYIRNYMMVGSIVSDNPQVFALPELDWKSYFLVVRGLNYWEAIVQYGIFKGWFRFEAYAMVFWLFGGGVALFLWRQGKGNVLRTLRSGCGVNGGAEDLLWIALALALTYFTAILTSVALSVDLAIRNDRYLLIVLPSAALLGAFFLHAMIIKAWALIKSPRGSFIVKDALLVVLWICALLVAIQTGFVGLWIMWRNVPTMKSSSYEVAQEPMSTVQALDAHFDRTIKNWPSLRVHKDLAQYVEDGEVILSLRPADMYYSNRRMISYLDPRLIPIYLEKSPHKAVEMLKSLGVGFVVVPNYSMPPIYNSSLMKILSDPRLSTLVESVHGQDLFKLEGETRRIEKTIELTPGKYPWFRSRKIKFVPSAITDRIGLQPVPFMGGLSEAVSPLFHQDYTTVLSSGNNKYFSEGEASSAISVEQGDYVVRMRVSGEGYVTLFVQEFVGNMTRISSDTVDYDRPFRLGDFPLSGDEHSFEFERRFRVGEAVRYIKFVIEHSGKSKVTIDKMILERLSVVAQ